MSSVWVPVLPSLKGFTQKIEGEARSASQRGGKVATEEFGKAGEASGRSLADGLKRQQALVSSASKTLGDARKSEAAASGAVKTAELELQRLRERGDSSAAKIAKAEEDLADKKRKAETAGQRLGRAEQELATVRDGGEASSRKLTSAEDRVVDARNKVEKATGDVRVADLRVTEAREKSESRAASLQAAEDNLASVRAEFGEDSKEAARAEREVESARKQAETAARGVIDTETTLAKRKGELQTANEAVASSTLSHKAVQEDLAASERAAGEEADRAASDIRGLGDEMEGADPKSHGLAGGLGSMAKQAGLAAAAFVGVRGIGDMISSGFDKVNAIEDTTASLGILMGSADEASDLMDELTESNMKTPYSFDAWAEAGKNLVAFGMEADDVTNTVMALGEAASASGKGEQALSSMADAFGKASASGKISMDLINSLAAGGVDGLTILGNAFDQSTGDMQKMISSGTVPVEEAFSALTEGIMEGSDGIAGSTNAMEGVMDEMSQTTSGQLGLLKMSFVNLGGDIVTLLMPAIQGLIDIGLNLVGWVRDLVSDFKEGEGAMGSFRSIIEKLQPAIKPAAVAVGALAAGMLAYNATMKVKATIDMAKAFLTMSGGAKKAALAQKGLNVAMWTSPITWIVAALAGLVAGLVYFFTQTETGQRVWDALMDTLSDAWQWITDTLGPVFEWIGDTAVAAWDGIKTGWDFLWEAMQTAWNSVIKPIFDAFVTAGQVLFAIVGTAVLAPLMIAWNLLSWAVQAGWETIIKPAWDALQTAAQWMWENVLSPVFGWIRTGWEHLSFGIQWAYENIILPTWHALQFAATWLWETILQPVFGWIRAGWEAMSTGIQWVYDTIIKPTWDALGTALSWLNDNIIQPVLGWIEDRWDTMSRAIEWVYDNVIQPVFDSISAGLDVVKGVFETAVDGIETVWDGLRSAAAKPVKFVIERVWNDGILKAWNLIADFVPGLDTVEPYSPAWLGDYHQGTSSIVPGARSVGRDNMDFVSTDGRYGISLAGQEGIAHQHVVDGIGRSNWDHLNQVGRTRGASAVREELGNFAGGGVIDLGHFAGGGTLQKNGNVEITTDIQRSMERAVAAAFPNQIITSGTRYVEMGSGYDNHMAGRALDFAADQSLATWIAKTYPHSAELFWDPGPNIKNGASTGAIGGHSNHVHWAMSSMVDPYTGEVVSQDGPGGGGGGGGGNWLYNKAKDIWDSTVGKIGDWIRDATDDWGDSKFATMPSKIYDETEEKVFNWIMDKIPLASGPSGGPGNIDWDISAGARQWEGVATSALARLGYGVDDLERTIAQIDIESTGDPNSINDWDDNAAIGDPTKGLLQVRGDTYNMMRGQYPGAFEGLPNDIWHPESNLTAGIAWTKYKYGGPANIWPTRAGYDNGGWLQPMDGQQLVYNHTKSPEAVLTATQWDAMIALPAEVRALVANLDNRWGPIADQAIAEFFDTHPDPVSSILDGMAEEALDFFGLSNTWMADPSLLDISWEVPEDDDSEVDADDHDDATVNDSLVGDVPAENASQASTREVSPDGDRVTLDRDMVVNIVMENVQTMDPDEIARETAREARRALAAFRF